MNFHSKPNTYVGHVNIKVKDLDRSLQFYRETLGFQILEKTNKTAKLTTDGKTNVLSIEQQENIVPEHGKTTGLYHYAILLHERYDLAELMYHFVEEGDQFS